MEGLLAAGGEHARFARKLICEWARSSIVLRDDPLSHVAPGVPLLTVFAEDRDEFLWNRSLERARVLADMTAGNAGARIHRPDLKGWEHEVWVDCMHLDGPFLAKLGTISGDPTWTDLAAGDEGKAGRSSVWSIPSTVSHPITRNARKSSNGSHRSSLDWRQLKPNLERGRQS